MNDHDKLRALRGLRELKRALECQHTATGSDEYSISRSGAIARVDDALAALGGKGEAVPEPLPDHHALLYFSRGGKGGTKRLIAAGVYPPPSAYPVYTEEQLRAYGDACARAAYTAAPKPVEGVTDAMVPASELRGLYRAYIIMLENARNRLLDHGCECDPVDVMEAGDPALRKARAALNGTQQQGAERG